MTEEKPVLDPNGYAICPDCKTQIHCGTGIVADSQSDGVLKCKKLGCETQWVAFRWTLFHEIGFARPARHLGQVEGRSDHGDDVTLPYMGTCLIT
ncbi:hypothetical protein K443DRAFT_665862 [Laccaria amethystina LaAM-08-1]|uniref:Uncharacterized protein n=1 Tax=Laccaria amethystina LaAM-08-1 TaxID=1095629 RepID=A0A0C9XRP0_9AGAR|nr:hypothetical protein K443DRAFT_665862 [Laccaria amethystina LaAM-08-1]